MQRFRQLPHVSPEAAYRRASGRRHYNAERRKDADERRARVLDLVNELWGKGINRKQMPVIIAERLQVHLATVYRDLKNILTTSPDHRCPLCGAKIHLERVEVEGER